MSNKFDVNRTVEFLVTAAMDYAAAGRHVGEEDAVRKQQKLLTAVIHEARRFVDTVNSLEAGEMPAAWRPLADDSRRSA